MLERQTIDYVFILGRLEEVYHAKGKKLCMCFVDIDKAFDKVQRKVLEWTMKKVRLARSMIGMYEGGKIMVRVDSKLSGEFEVNVAMHHVSVLSHFLFALGVDVVTEFTRECVLSELLYTDGFVLMSETIERFRDKFF